MSSDEVGGAAWNTMEVKVGLQEARGKLVLSKIRVRWTTQFLLQSMLRWDGANGWRVECQNGLG